MVGMANPKDLFAYGEWPCSEGPIGDRHPFPYNLQTAIRFFRKRYASPQLACVAALYRSAVRMNQHMLDSSRLTGDNDRHRNREKRMQREWNLAGQTAGRGEQKHKTTCLTP